MREFSSRVTLSILVGGRSGRQGKTLGGLGAELLVPRQGNLDASLRKSELTDFLFWRSDVL